jgi:hypothetical protein
MNASEVKEHLLDNPEKVSYLGALAQLFTTFCVRNCLEDLHAGRFPSSKTGDYSDVKVVSPYGEIPWNEVSRFNDDEMKTLMKVVMNQMFSHLLILHARDEDFKEAFLMAGALWLSPEWDSPELTDKFCESAAFISLSKAEQIAQCIARENQPK